MRLLRFRTLWPQSPAPVPRPELALVLLLTLAGLATRVAVWGFQRVPGVRGLEHLREAQALGGAPVGESPVPYLYPALAALVRPLAGGDLELAGRLVALVAGLALIPLAWWVARSFVDRWPLRLLVPAAVAFLPLTVRYSVVASPDALALALLLAGFGCVFRERTIRGGVLLGLAFATRPETLFASLTLLVLVALVRRDLLRGILPGAAAVVALFVLVSFVDRGSVPLDLPDTAPATWFERDAVLGVESLTYAAAGPHSGPARWGGLLADLVPYGGYWVPVVALVGLVSGPAALLGAGLVPLLVAPWTTFGDHPRFVLPYLPFLWILAAVAVDRLRRPLFAGLAGLVVVAGLALSVAGGEDAYQRNEDGYYPELVATGKALGPMIPPGSRIMEQRPYVSFYAEAVPVPFPPPAPAYDPAVDAIVASSADFVVFHEGLTAVYRPVLLQFATDKPVVFYEPRFRPVHIDDDYIEGRVLVFRVVRPGGVAALPSETGIKKAIGVVPHGPEHFMHGVLMMRSGNLAAAADEFTLAANRFKGEPEEAAAWNNRAWCLAESGRDLEDANTAARKAVDLEPANPEYLDTLIHVLTLLGRTEAVDYWRAKYDEAVAAQEGGS